MSTSAPIDPTLPTNVTPPPSFEETLRKFWEKNSKLVYATCAAVLLVIVGRGAFLYYEDGRDEGIAAEYAASNSSEKLKAFAAAHSDHLLSGAALLQLADEAYAAAKYADAIASYEKSASILKSGPLASRAAVGSAISKSFAGRSGEAEEALKKIAADGALPKPIRAEATYHLGALAAEAGRIEDAAKFFDQVQGLDQAGLWAQRAVMQRATLPSTAITTPQASAGK